MIMVYNFCNLSAMWVVLSPSTTLKVKSNLENSFLKKQQKISFAILHISQESQESSYTTGLLYTRRKCSMNKASVKLFLLVWMLDQKFYYVQLG